MKLAISKTYLTSSRKYYVSEFINYEYLYSETILKCMNFTKLVVKFSEITNKNIILLASNWKSPENIVFQKLQAPQGHKIRTEG